MSSGGARGRSGPAPNPDAIRRDRPSDGATWVTLPSERVGPTPEWPLMPIMSPSEGRHWEMVWRLPQATEWEKNRQEVEVALYVRSLAEAELPGATAGLRTLVKQLHENLGLSIPGLLKYRWRIGDQAPATPAATATKTARPARANPARDRFRVVPSTGD